MKDVKLFDNRILFKDELVTETDMPTLFTGKRIVMFGLPGAFTPTCSSKQVPAYEDMYEQFIDTNKVDDVYCVSVNFGYRSWRYSAYVVNGIVKEMFIEPGINNMSADEDPYEESTPEKILEYVKSL